MKRNLLLLLFMLGCIGAWSQCTPIVYDDFESGAMNPAWALGGGHTRTFPTTGSPQGTTHLWQAGSSTHYAGSVWNFASSTPSYMSWWSKSSSNANNCSYFVVGDANTSTNNGIVFCYFTSSGTVRFYNNTINYEYPTVANTWYHIELMNINFTAKTFDLYINGSLAQFGYPFRSTSTVDVNQVHMYNYDPGSNGFYDEIIIGAAPLAATLAASSPSCYGDTNGTASVTVTSGAAPYTYLWSNGATSASLSGLGAGTYSYTVTAANGCTTEDTTTLVEPSAILDSLSMTAPTCSYNTDGTITLSLSGGTPAYSYLWNTGATTPGLTGVGAGTYTVDFMDANGCAGSDTVVLMAPTPFTFTCLPTDVSCFGAGDGSLTATASGGTPGYTYLWNTGATTASLSGLGAGVYSLTALDLNGCMYADTFVINEPTAINATGTTTDDTGTNNGAIDLTVSGGTPSYTYLWSNGATTEDLSGISAGTYTVTVTDANGCTSTSTFTVDLLIGVQGGNTLAVTAWPSPFTDHLKLQLPVTSEPVQVMLFDLRGTAVFAQTMVGGGIAELDLRSIAAGTYLLQVRLGAAQRILRVVKN